MPSGFSDQDRYDLKEIFRIYDFSKVEKVNDVVDEAEKKGKSPTQVFDDLYSLYKIQKLPQREAVAKRLHMAVSNASDADVESVLRQTEMKGFSERDAVRSLERKYSVQHVTNRTLQAARNNLNSFLDASTNAQSELQRTTSSLRHVTVNESSVSVNSATAAVSGGVDLDDDVESSVVFARPPSHLSAAPTRENLDDIMSEEVRDWLAKMLGEKYNADVLALPNFIDALRNGVLLHVLLQKMQDPPVADADLKLPKRITGFFIRDNVATFLKEAKKRYELVDAQLFTDSDLVDGKSDRQVITCLMAMARIAYSAGSIKLAPNIIMYEHEIEQQEHHLTKHDLDRIVREAEAREGESIPSLRADDLARHLVPSPPSAGHSPVAIPSPPKSAPASPPSAVAAAAKAATANTNTHSTESAPAVNGTATKTEVAAPAPANKEEVEEEEQPQRPSTPPAAPGRLPRRLIPTEESAADQEGTPRAPKGARDSPALDISPPTTVDRTLSPTKSKNSLETTITPKKQDSSAANTSPKASPEPPSVVLGAKSPPQDEAPHHEKEANSQPRSEDLHTPPEHAVGEDADATPVKETTEAKPTSAQPKKEDADDDDQDGDGGGRVFYLRDGMLRPAKPTPEEELELQEQRKKAGPRVVWKSPSSPLAATKPPRYHSRHWDGIDVALGRQLNEHYGTHPHSPWRFHMVASTSGEYVLYNRQNAIKRVIYLRLIQTRLFLRNAGKNQSWVRFDEALAGLEKAA